MSSTDNIAVPTPTCFVCGNGGEVALTFDQFERLQGDGLMQDKLSEVSLDVREQLISGTHPACWDSIFGE
jgi:hypothetical protein